MRKEENNMNNHTIYNEDTLFVDKYRNIKYNENNSSQIIYNEF